MPSTPAIMTGSYSTVSIGRCAVTRPARAPSPPSSTTARRGLPCPGPSECKVPLISTGGLYLKGADPFGPDAHSQEEAIPRIQEYVRRAPGAMHHPAGCPAGGDPRPPPGLRYSRHLRDYNVIFPVDRLKELQAEGVFGELAEENYSFVGATSQKRLLAEAAPAWAERLKEEQIDAVLLVGA